VGDAGRPSRLCDVLKRRKLKITLEGATLPPRKPAYDEA
jgi:hypothetical protein